MNFVGIALETFFKVRFKDKSRREFSGYPVVGTLLSLLKAQVQSLIEELRSCKLSRAAKNNEPIIFFK